jgi:UrcA family protein
MKNTSLKNVVTASAFSLGILLAGQASAEAIQDQSLSAQYIETQSISIPYTAGDLATNEGRADLYREIKRAAKRVCGPTGAREAGGLKLAARNRQCLENTLATAIGQVETGQLASLSH